MRIGVKSVETEMGVYKAILDVYVSALWAFDENSELIYFVVKKNTYWP